MSTERAQQLLAAIRALPRGDRLRIVERIVHEIARRTALSRRMRSSACSLTSPN